MRSEINPVRIIAYTAAALLVAMVLSFVFFLCVLPLVGLAIYAPAYRADLDATATAQAHP